MGGVSAVMSEAKNTNTRFDQTRASELKESTEIDFSGGLCVSGVKAGEARGAVEVLMMSVVVRHTRLPIQDGKVARFSDVFSSRACFYHRKKESKTPPIDGWLEPASLL